MQATIQSSMVLYSLPQAESIAAKMNASDDWEYKVVDCQNGKGRIDVYDEDGFLIHKGFGV